MNRSWRVFLAPALTGMVVLAIWARLIAKLSTDWSINPQYEFGFFVPMLILYLLARRWADHPKPSHFISTSALLMLSIGLLLAFLPLRIVEEGNPDWRPLTWVCALLVVMATLMPITYVGGLAWTRHFIIPLALIFVAIPWPLPMEETVIQTLTRTVTALTTELLNWLNVPAVQHGNVIEVATGSVDVAEACSGIRSLQGTLMAGVFFGELYRCAWLRRILLIIAGAALAIGLNSCRTLFLGWIAAVHGMDALSRWHDRAGYGIFVVSFACLWFTAWYIRAPQSSDESSASAESKTFPAIQIPVAMLTAIGIWLLAIEAVTFYWYSMRERNLGDSISWSIKWPKESPTFRFAPMPEKVQSVLRYSQGTTALLDEPGGTSWQMFYLQWDPGRTSAQLVSMHRPEICLPAHGLEFVSDAGVCEVNSPQLNLPFHCSIFNASGQTMYVFRCLWEDRPMSGPGRERTYDLSLNGRLASAWYGRRNLGEKLVQIAIVGAHDIEEAKQNLQNRLPSMIEVK